MGLFGRKRKSQRLAGTARVVSTTHAPHGASYGNLQMDLVIEVPGVPAYAHGYSKLVTPVSKWPHGGQVLPVTIDPEDHDDVEIDWDELPKNSDIAQDQAERLAATLRGETPTGSIPPGGAISGDVGSIVSSIQQMFPGATVSAGGAGGGVAPPPGVAGTAGINVVASQSGGDPVERLEKLAKLRAAGIIDDAQFEQLRAQILGQAGLG